MKIRNGRPSASKLARHGQRLRGVEPLEPRTVLSASFFPSYLGPPSPPTPPQQRAGEFMMRAVDHESSPNGYDPNEPPVARFEPHRAAEFASAPWQITIILLPVSGVSVDRGSSYLLENNSHASQGPVSSGQQASYPLHAETAREARKLDGLEIESLAL